MVTTLSGTKSKATQAKDWGPQNMDWTTRVQCKSKMLGCLRKHSDHLKHQESTVLTTSFPVPARWNLPQCQWLYRSHTDMVYSNSHKAMTFDNLCPKGPYSIARNLGQHGSGACASYTVMALKVLKKMYGQQGI